MIPAWNLTSPRKIVAAGLRTGRYARRTAGAEPGRCRHGPLCAVVLTTWLAGASALAAPVAVRGVTIEGVAVEGTWSGVTPSGAVTLIQDGQKKEFAPEELMLLRWAEPPSSRPATASQPATVYLADGSILQGAIAGSDAGAIVFRTRLAPDLKLPLAQLAAVRLMPAAHPAAEEAFERALANRDPAQDLLLVLREDRLTTLKGVTESLTAQGGSFKWRERSVPLRPDTAYGIVFAVGVQKPAAPQALVVLKDGCMWGGRLAGGDAGEVKLERAGGLQVDLPVAELAEIRFRSDRVLFLSQLEPAEYVFEPFGTTRWPYRVNRSVANRPMRIGDQHFERGIGMHSQSTLTYDLPDAFSRLAAVIGIDAAVAPLGNVVFRVTADGKEVFHSGPVTGRDAPRPITVPIEGARRIQLIVEFGEELDIGDQADWGNVRVIK